MVVVRNIHASHASGNEAIHIGTVFGGTGRALRAPRTNDTSDNNENVAKEVSVDGMSTVQTGGTYGAPGSSSTSTKRGDFMPRIPSAASYLVRRFCEQSESHPSLTGNYDEERRDEHVRPLCQRSLQVRGLEKIHGAGDLDDDSNTDRVSKSTRSQNQPHSKGSKDSQDGMNTPDDSDSGESEYVSAPSSPMYDKDAGDDTKPREPLQTHHAVSERDLRCHSGVHGSAITVGSIITHGESRVTIGDRVIRRNAMPGSSWKEPFW